MESKELFRALTGDAKRLKDYVNKTVTVKEADMIVTDKPISILKMNDGELLVSSSKNVTQLVPLLKNMTNQGTVDLFVTATDIGNGKSTISVKLKG